MDFFFFIRYYKEYFFPTCKFNFGKIFELPTEIMNLIILEFASSTSWNSKYWNSRQLIMLGLINKATLLAVNNFCKIQCQKFCLFDQTVNPVKLYSNILYFDDVKLPSNKTIHYFENIICFKCFYNTRGFFIISVNLYKCAFLCRVYYYYYIEKE